MELTKTEQAALRQTKSQQETDAIHELADVQLAMIGGGFTEVNLT